MSTTYIANIVAIAAFLLPHLGIQVVDPGTFGAAVATVVAIASSAYVFYGRFKAGGINILGLRKS